MAVTLYQIEPSFYSQIARLALEEKGVAWHDRPVNIGPLMENYEPWYMRIHPSGVVPALDHDGHIVLEARDIIAYIDQHLNEDGPALTPSEPSQRAEMDRWLDRLAAFPVRELSYGTMGQRAVGPIIGFSYKLRRRVLRRHIKANPDLAALYQRRIDDIDAWQATSQDPAQVDQLKQQLQGTLDDLEDTLNERGPWLLGDQYTLADVWWTILLARLVQFGMSDWWEGGKRPQVEAYYQRLSARPSFEGAHVWTGIRPGFMIRMIAPFLLPRLLAATVVLSAAGYGLWWLLAT